MLTISEFEKRITNLNPPGWLRITVNEANDKEIYITGYAGMGETMSRSIASFGSEIENYVREKLKKKLLIKASNKCYLLQDLGVRFYPLVHPENQLQSEVG